jgi:hypothetical protein
MQREKFRDKLEAAECVRICAEEMAILREFCREAGWERPYAPADQQDAAEFYAFLIEKLDGPKVVFARRTFTGVSPDESDCGAEEQLSVVPVDINTDVPDLEHGLDQWFYENVVQVSRAVDDDVCLKTEDGIERRLKKNQDVPNGLCSG